MDLLSTVRKEGSRGGRGDFKWSDVQSSSHRENYLGHSLMAPVGRWQQGRDLNWYAKGDGDEGGAAETAAEKEERHRKEEIKRIKEAEQDALARALGYDVPPRNPNMESLGDRKELDKILKDVVAEEDDAAGTGVGYGKFGTNHGDSTDRILGSHAGIPDAGREKEARIKTDRPHRRRRRSRSPSRSGLRDRDRDRDRNRDRDSGRHRRRRNRDEDDRHRRSQSRSRERTRRRRSRSRDMVQHKKREDRKIRSRSPYYNERDSRRDDHYNDRDKTKDDYYERRR